MDSKKYLYEQVENFLMDQIEMGIFIPGHPIPSERQLAQQLDVNRNTIKKAISSLVEKGYLITRQGVGNYVKKFDSALFLGNVKHNTQSGMNELVRLTGKIPSNKVVESAIIYADGWTSSQMNLHIKEPLFSLARVRYSDEEVFAFEHTLIPEKYFPDISEKDFSKLSLYSYMEQSGHKVSKISRSLNIIRSNDSISKYLSIKPGTLIYSFNFLGKDNSDNIIEYTNSYVRIDQVRFSTFPD